MGYTYNILSITGFFDIIGIGIVIAGFKENTPFVSSKD